MNFKTSLISVRKNPPDHDSIIQVLAHSLAILILYSFSLIFYVIANVQCSVYLMHREIIL